MKTDIRHMLGQLTLRDYFAGQALTNLGLQAHVASPAAANLAASAYEIADAMLAHRTASPCPDCHLPLPHCVCEEA